MSLGTNLSSKAVILAAVATLAACSRNPQPGDETGRADTTMVTDTTQVPVPRATPADTMIPRTPLPDTSKVRPDTNVVRPDTNIVRPDTSVVRDSLPRDSMPYPRNVPDTNRP